MNNITRHIIFLCLLCLWMPVQGQTNPLNIDSVLNVLDREIALRPTYKEEKEQKIHFLKEGLRQSSDMRKKFDVYTNLFKEYQYYQYDSAYVYASRSLEAARAMQDAESIAWAKCYQIYCYTSVGFFKEATEVIQGFSTEGLSARALIEYYSQCAHMYQNLTTFVAGTDSLESAYRQALEEAQRQVLKYVTLNDDTYLRNLTEDVLAIEKQPVEQTVEMRKQILAKYNLNLHEQGMQYIMIGEAALKQGKRDEAIYYTALSAIHDIRSNTHETTAAKAIALFMHEEGELDRAVSYIHLAQDDADFYNTRLRKAEIGTLLFMIENSRYDYLNKQRIFLFIVTGIIGLLLLALFGMFARLKKSNRKLHDARQEIEEKVKEVDCANRELTDTNARLHEANEIKDRYIIQSLYGDSAFVNTVEEKCKLIERKVKAKQYADLAHLATEIGIKQERERMSSAFDSAFLKLFPNFPDEYNRLFPPEHHITVTEGTALPTEVRIFALMRLGIEDTVQVAKYLNLSQNTIYVYKTKVKAKASVAKEDFDKLIMQIPKP